MTHPHRAAAIVLACVLAASACGPGTLDPLEERRQSSPVPGEQCSDVDTDEQKSFVPPALAATRATVASTRAGELDIDWVPYPLPYPEAKVWAIWGKGLVASNGRYYSAVGDGNSPTDGLATDGNTVLYEYDPNSRTLRAVGDVLSAFGMHVAGETGYGKIQGQVGEGPCGLLYLHTYWSSPTTVVYAGNYQGDLLLRYNPFTEHLESLGVKIPRLGVPSMTLVRPRGLIYGEANTPTDPKEVIFWAYEIASDAIVFQSTRRQRNDRSIAVDSQGRAFYMGLGSDLFRYDPVSNAESELGVAFPGGGWLRASTRVGADGTIVMITTEPDEAYVFDPASATLTLLATLPRPIADIELDPTGRVAYFVPVGLDGLPGFELDELDRATGSVRRLVDLGAAIEAAGGSRPRGGYSVNASTDGRTTYIAANSGEPDGFGVPVFIAVHLPDSAMP